jgi:hypothetical protein
MIGLSKDKKSEAGHLSEPILPYLKDLMKYDLSADVNEIIEYIFNQSGDPKQLTKEACWELHAVLKNKFEAILNEKINRINELESQQAHFHKIIGKAFRHLDYFNQTALGSGTPEKGLKIQSRDDLWTAPLVNESTAQHIQRL